MPKSTTPFPAWAPTSPPTEDKDKLNFERQKMEPWYDPGQLARTALRTILSSLFGTYADKREMQACLKASEPYIKLADKDEVWIDYISDLGSGFNSTYSLAYLLGKEELHVAGHDTKRGNLLIMGGDEVYPTPSWEQYANRLIGPYRSAKSFISEPNAPRLFAIPGNHDWYDGLTSFLKVFCQQRWIGAWKTEQTRSYFAIQLPHNWWLWGIDIQLSEDIDLPQQEFFERVNRNFTKPGDKVILCTAEPSWVYQAYKRRDKSFRNLEWFCERYITDPNLRAKPPHPTDGPLKKLTLPVTITGDMHHYSSYFYPPTDPDNPTVPPLEWKITAGGGGAFMHPTHHLPVDFKEDEDLLYGQRKPKEYQSKAFYPDQKKSRRLVLGNLLFLIKNPWFTSLMGALYLFFTWMMVSAELFKPAYDQSDPWVALCRDLSGLIRHPFLLLVTILIGAGFISFADRSHKRNRWAANAGGLLHGVIQVVSLLMGTWFIDHFCKLIPTDWERISVQSLALLLIGGLIGGLVMGVYLLIANGIFGTHETEAFSSLRIQDYKNFLRLHLTKDHLTIYPVNVEQVPRQWTYQANMTNGEPWFEPDSPLHAGLIEPPIIIDNLMSKKTA
ncbi:hypothetical protein EXU85_07910 [Spirosoma sp. KCTC 42546]|uniref:metallophosphoesterase n=1 Tax=Spirosoma sp. KCTC 42546 TaxID=2520506 RepID=UPI00115BF54B|nr:metallophosphoesterase [Spirosoma sp. KCTC 42546]QDK78538.1 hypothetical protein EXU85_07910 [Spirosoma sp. KCTC 42546]